MSTLTVTSINSADLDTVAADTLKAGAHYDCVTNIIHKSLNVSSMVDQAVGNFTFNLTNAMADDIYMSSATTAETRNNDTTVNQAQIAGVTYMSTTYFRVDNMSDGGSPKDGQMSNVICFGDLA